MNVAVIIPTCCRDTLSRAIKSVLTQTKKAAQIIVVKDANGDISIPKDDSIKIITTRGGLGCVGGRDLAISTISNGIDAICYLDDDDELLPNHIELLTRKIKEGYQYAFSKAIFRYPNGTETEDPEPGNQDPNKAYYNPVALLTQNIAPVSSFIHTMQAYRQVGGWDRSVPRMEDWDLWARMFIEFGPPGKVDQVTNVIYRDLGPNMTTGNRFSYAMCCHWRDLVSKRIQYLSSKGKSKLSNSEATKLAPPQIGVVLPVYNAQEYLHESLESLRMQTLQDFEVIAVNDGSTDESLRILQEFRERNIKDNLHEIRIFNLPQNMGVTKTLNYGVMMSRSPYVARMDADDVAMPERFEKQVAFLGANPDIGILGTHFWSMDAKLQVIKWDNQVPTAPEDVARTLLDYCCVGHPTVMMRRIIFERIGGYDEGEEFKAVEDYELWLRASKSYKIANLPDYLLKYREHPSQTGNKLRALQKVNMECVRQKYRDTETCLCLQKHLPSSLQVATDS